MPGRHRFRRLVTLREILDRGRRARPPAAPAPTAFHCQVEQVTVDEKHGALFSRLHRRGHAIGRGTHLLYVRRERDGHTVALRPDLVRVLTTDGA